MNVRAKSAALLTTMAVAGGALAQSDPETPVRYTEFGTELVPTATSAPGLQVQAVQWMQRDDHAIGLALGMQTSPGLDAAMERARASIGLRWRSRFNDRQRLDVTTWRHLLAARDDTTSSLLSDTDPAPVTTRIEMQFVPKQTRGFGIELGAVGLQLSSDTKLQLRIRRGGPMVYYRARF